MFKELLEISNEYGDKSLKIENGKPIVLTHYEILDQTAFPVYFFPMRFFYTQKTDTIETQLSFDGITLEWDSWNDHFKVILKDAHIYSRDLPKFNWQETNDILFSTSILTNWISNNEKDSGFKMIKDKATKLFNLLSDPNLIELNKLFNDNIREKEFDLAVILINYLFNN